MLEPVEVGFGAKAAAGDGDSVGADAAPAASSLGVPGRLRNPCATRAGGGQVGGADRGNIGVFRWIEIWTDGRVEGSIVPGSDEDSLPLCCKLLKENIVYRRIVRNPAPRHADLPGDILRRHRVEYACIVQHGCGTDIHADLAQTWSHADCLHDVEHLFGIVPCGRPGSAIQQHVVDGDAVGLPGTAEGCIHIAEAVAAELQNPNCLSGAG